MADHIINEVYVDGVNVAKGGVRDYHGRVLFAADADDVRARILTQTELVLLRVNAKPVLLARDDDDSSTADDGENCILDFQSKRFKRRAIAAADLTAAMLNTVLGAGGLDLAAIPGAGVKKLLGSVASAWAALTVGDLVGWLDDYFGSTVWRQDLSNLTSAIAGLPDNDWKQTGGSCGINRAVRFADGTVGVAGYMGHAGPDGGATALGRFTKIGFADGVARTITKFFAGGSDGASSTTSLYALDDSGLPWAWGYNASGQLGLGDTTARNVWTEIAFFRTNSLTVAEVSCAPSGRGAWFRCSNGQLYYAGGNGNGEAGDGTTGAKSTPVRCGTLTGVTDVFPGSYSSSGADCVGALAGGTFYTWGYNATGNLGLGDTTQRTAPTGTGLTNVTKATLGQSSLALKSDGTLWAAGDNTYGATAQGTFSGTTNAWTQIASLGTSVLDFATSNGIYVSCAAIITGKNLRSWGRNPYGQLGLANTTDQNTVQTPAGSFQGAVDEVGFAFNMSDIGAMFVRAGNAIHAAGYNGVMGLCVGNATSPVTTAAPVVGLRGNIAAWSVMGTYSGLFGLIVLTDEACLSGGYNLYGQCAVHEASFHNVSVLQEVLITAANVPGLPAMRELLAADRTYYVRADGNDANTGLADSAAGAFLTIQKAIDVIIGTLDIGGKIVTIQLADGTYAGVSVTTSPVGGNIVVNGNAATPENVVISQTSGDAVNASAAAIITLQNLELRTVTGGYSVNSIGSGAIVRLGAGMRLGAAASGLLRAYKGGNISVLNNLAIVGGATHGFLGTVAGMIVVEFGVTITVTGTPAFTAFARAFRNSIILVQPGASFSGTATGIRYQAETNSVIDSAGGGASFFPGNSAGTLGTGAQYS